MLGPVVAKVRDLLEVVELNSKLGIIHSNIEGVVTDRKTVKNIDAYLLKEESTIGDVFNLKIIKTDKKNRTFKKNIEFLNKTYGTWRDENCVQKEKECKSIYNAKSILD